MDKFKIGTNAGVVWNLLDKEKKGMNFEELLMKADLSVVDLSAAIGWLAREDKIWHSTSENGVGLYSVFQNYYY